MSRAESLAALASHAELDWLLVGDLVNVRYLTGFTGTNGLVLAGARPRFLTDFRYGEQAAAQVHDHDLEVIEGGELLGALDASLRGRIGFDDTQLTVRQLRRLTERLPNAELVPCAGLPERLRAVKDPEEIERIRAAAQLIDELFGWVVDRGVAGRTERELALDLEQQMRLRGAEGPSFPSIVASGAHGALPHAGPRDAPIEVGGLLTIDMGARLDGYCSDCTRTLAVGEPTEHARAIYSLVREAQQAGLDGLQVGRSGREVDHAARELIERAGHGEHFGHGLGHGVGLEIHEAPRLSRLAGNDPLQDGTVVTVEPGVYLPGELGVRIEDLVVLEAAGPTILSSFTKELLSVA